LFKYCSLRPRVICRPRRRTPLTRFYSLEHIEDYHPFYPTVESYIVVNSCSWNDLVENYLLKRKQERSIQVLAFPNTLLDSRPPTDQEILDIYLCASNYTLSRPLTIEFLG
jgi:hypothetical protein